MKFTSMQFIQIRDKSTTQKQYEGLAFLNYYFIIFFSPYLLKSAYLLKSESYWSRLAPFQFLVFNGNPEIIFCLYFLRLVRTRHVMCFEKKI